MDTLHTILFVVDNNDKFITLIITAVFIAVMGVGRFILKKFLA